MHLRQQLGDARLAVSFRRHFSFYAHCLSFSTPRLGPRCLPPFLLTPIKNIKTSQRSYINNGRIQQSNEDKLCIHKYVNCVIIKCLEILCYLRKANTESVAAERQIAFEICIGVRHFSLQSNYLLGTCFERYFCFEHIVRLRCNYNPGYFVSFEKEKTIKNPRRISRANEFEQLVNDADLKSLDNESVQMNRFVTSPSKGSTLLSDVPSDWLTSYLSDTLTGLCRDVPQDSILGPISNLLLLVCHLEDSVSLSPSAAALRPVVSAVNDAHHERHKTDYGQTSSCRLSFRSIAK